MNIRSPHNTKVLGVICLGDSYIRRFAKISLPSFRRFAERYSYDLHVFDEPLDSCIAESKRKKCVPWQKCLIPSRLLDYEQLLILDSDILISPLAGDPLELVPTDKIGAVLEPARGRLGKRNQRIQEFPDGEAFYRETLGRKVQDPPSTWINSGVLAGESRLMTSVLEKAYHEGVEFLTTTLWDQPEVSYQIMSGGYFAELPFEYNALWPEIRANHYPFLATREDFLWGQTNFGRLQQTFRKFRCRALSGIYADAIVASLLQVSFLHFSGNKMITELLSSKHGWWDKLSRLADDGYFSKSS